MLRESQGLIKILVAFRRVSKIYDYSFGLLVYGYLLLGPHKCSQNQDISKLCLCHGRPCHLMLDGCCSTVPWGHLLTFFTQWYHAWTIDERRLYVLLLLAAQPLTSKVKNNQRRNCMHSSVWMKGFQSTLPSEAWGGRGKYVSFQVLVGGQTHWKQLWKHVWSRHFTGNLILMLQMKYFHAHERQVVLEKRTIENAAVYETLDARRGCDY